MNSELPSVFPMSRIQVFGNALNPILQINITSSMGDCKIIGGGQLDDCYLASSIFGILEKYNNESDNISLSLTTFQ